MSDDHAQYGLVMTGHQRARTIEILIGIFGIWIWRWHP